MESLKQSDLHRAIKRFAPGYKQGEVFPSTVPQCEICGYFSVWDDDAKEILIKKGFDNPAQAETMVGCVEMNRLVGNRQSQEKHDAFNKGFRMTPKGMATPIEYFRPLRRGLETNDYK